MTVGERIKDLRQIKKMTLRDLAQKINISISFLSDIENNRSNPSLDRLREIARGLSTTPSYLLGEDLQKLNNPPPQKTKRIIHSLARAKNLSTDDYDLIADQVERLIEYAEKKQQKEEEQLRKGRN